MSCHLKILAFSFASTAEIRLKKASDLTGIKKKTTLIRMGLEALISKECAERLAQLGGTEKRLKYIKRRKVV